MYLAMHEGEPPTGDLHPHPHAHAGRTPRDEADNRPLVPRPPLPLFVAVRAGEEYGGVGAGCSLSLRR